MISPFTRTVSDTVRRNLNETAPVLRDKGRPVVHQAGGVPEPGIPQDGSLLSASVGIAAAEGPYTRALIRYPSNSSSIMSPRASLVEPVGFLARTSRPFMMDDTYDRLVFNGTNPVNCYEFPAQHPESCKPVPAGAPLRDRL